jgi:hypothetical protein
MMILLPLFIGVIPGTAYASYCEAAQSMSTNMSAYKELVSELAQRCRPGDTIVLEGVPQVVGILCDFTKAIVAQGRTVTCVMTLPRQLR